MGLMRGVQKWEWRRGLRFSTYAIPWIRQFCYRGLQNQRVIRLPDHMRHKVDKLRKERAAFYRERSRNPTDAEMAQRLGLSFEAYAIIDDAARPISSLDQPVVFKDSPKTRLDMLPTADSIYGADTFLLRDELVESVRQLLKELPQPDRYILKHKYGLDGVDEQTQKKVADALGMSLNRVKTTHSQALNRLLVTRRSQLEDLMQTLSELDISGAPAT